MVQINDFLYRHESKSSRYSSPITIEALKVSYISYHERLKRILELTHNEQLSHLHTLSLDIAKTLEPFVEKGIVWDYFEELKSSCWDEMRSENPPFLSLSIGNIERDIDLLAAKILYLNNTVDFLIQSLEDANCPDDKNSNNGSSSQKSPNSTTEPPNTHSPEESILSSFGLPSSEKALWGKIYRQLVHKKWLNAEEVTQDEFTYIICSSGKARSKPIIWHGPSNVLAYIIRRHMIDADDRWTIASAVFLGKNSKPIPSLQTLKSPALKTQKSIDEMFIIARQSTN